MTSQTRVLISRALFTIALGLAGAGVQAASGFNVTPDQQSQVTTGMSRSEVLQVLGQPAIERQYGNQPGQTWVYRLLDFDGGTVHVDFGADGRVTSTSKQLNYSGDTVSQLR